MGLGECLVQRLRQCVKRAVETSSIGRRSKTRRPSATPTTQTLTSLQILIVWVLGRIPSALQDLAKEARNKGGYIATSTFLRDKALGEEAEVKVQKHLNNQHGGRCYFSQSQGFIKSHDLFCLWHGERVEVKRDIKAEKTGNLCIERALFESSKSQIIAYVIGTTAFIFDRTELWEQVKQLKREGKIRSIMGGDRDANKLILMKLEDITHIAQEVQL